MDTKPQGNVREIRERLLKRKGTLDRNLVKVKAGGELSPGNAVHVMMAKSAAKIGDPSFGIFAGEIVEAGHGRIKIEFFLKQNKDRNWEPAMGDEQRTISFEMRKKNAVVMWHGEGMTASVSNAEIQLNK
ncbi:MAG: hypothetical protein ABH854_02200 [Candidatus Diapherotrites archaeon]